VFEMRPVIKSIQVNICLMIENGLKEGDSLIRIAFQLFLMVCH
jgi:hypothetical protein